MVNVCRHLATILAIGMVWTSSPLWADLSFQAENVPANYRFVNSPEFIGNPHDWSGIGRTESGRWVTMISPSYFISATHFAPLQNELVTFFQTNDTASAAKTLRVESGIQIAGSDVWLGKLNGVTDFGTFAVAGATSLPAGQELMIVGGGTKGFVRTDITQAQSYGRNTVDLFIRNFSDNALGNTVGDVIVYDFDTPVGGVGPNEAKINSGDSGGPTFIIFNGRPLLVGIHWFEFSGGDFPLAATGSGDTFVPSYVNAINAAMVGQQLTVVSVPEPASWMLVSLAAAPLAMRRWRAKRSVADASVLNANDV